MNQKNVKDTSEALYVSLKEEGYDVLFDDRDESPGIKFKDADLIGVPIRLTISKRTLKDDVIEMKVRRTGEVRMIAKENILDETGACIKES